MSDKAQPVILAVDDSTDMLALVEKALSDEYQVITASDPGTAIEKAFGDPRPDLILLDVDMPDIGGFEVCRALKDEPTTSGIPTSAFGSTPRRPRRSTRSSPRQTAAGPASSGRIP